MPRGADRNARAEARRIFSKYFAAGTDYRAAAEAAGVSPRTGRRWRDEVEAGRARVAAGLTHERALTRFFGRDQDLRSLCSLVRDGARLVTVVGPPGIGKTRLVQRYVETELQRGLETWFCDLRTATSAEDLRHTLTGSLEISLTGSAPDDEVGAALAARGPCLVVLDNLDQIDDEGTGAIIRWLRRAPDAHFLCTSRRMLGVTAEYAYELGPMSLPSSPEQADGEAVALFVDRALAAEPTFPADDVTVQTKVGRLVTELEGLPLAIEIAAAQVVHSSPETILQQLPVAQLALETGPVDADARHASLARALDGSWKLLSPNERDVLGQLSVFRGGFTLPAAAAVVRYSGDTPPLANLLVSLRRKSWLRMGTTAGGDVRWDMYEAIRQYTAAHIAHAPSRNQAAQARHAAYFTRLVARQEPARIRLTETASRLALLDELHNLRAAHASLLSSDSTNGDADDSNLPIAVELGLAIHELLKTSLPSLAIETVSRTLLRTITPKWEAEQAQLRVARAEAYLLTGQYPRAAQDLELAKPLVTSDTETGCGWLHQHAMVMFRLGRCCRAQKELVLALEKATSIGFELEARIRRDLGYVRCEAFRDRDGLRQLDRAAELFAAHGNAIGEARALTYGAMYRTLLSGTPSADGILEVVNTGRRMRCRWTEATGLLVLGLAAHADRDLDLSQSYYEEGRRIARRSGIPHTEFTFAHFFGLLLEEKNDSPGAREAYEKAIQHLTRLSATQRTALTRLCYAGLLARNGDREQADQVLSKAEFSFRRTARGRRYALPEAQQLRRTLGLRDPPSRRNRSGKTHALHTTTTNTFLGQLLSRVNRPKGSLERHPIRIHPEGRAFQVNGSKAVSLAGRPVLHRVLVVLAAERASPTGEPIRTESLLRQAWPNERMQRRAGQNRARNAIAQLRSMGLRDAIITSSAGWYLDRSIGFEWCSDLSAATQ